MAFIQHYWTLSHLFVRLRSKHFKRLTLNGIINPCQVNQLFRPMWLSVLINVGSLWHTTQLLYIICLYVKWRVNRKNQPAPQPAMLEMNKVYTVCFHKGHCAAVMSCCKIYVSISAPLKAPQILKSLRGKCWLCWRSKCRLLATLI